MIVLTSRPVGVFVSSDFTNRGAFRPDELAERVRDEDVVTFGLNTIPRIDTFLGTSATPLDGRPRLTAGDAIVVTSDGSEFTWYDVG